MGVVPKVLGLTPFVDVNCCGCAMKRGRVEVGKIEGGGMTWVWKKVWRRVCGRFGLRRWQWWLVWRSAIGGTKSGLKGDL